MRRSLLFMFGALLLSAACAQQAPYTWVQSLPPEPDPRTITTISPGDVVDVRVFGQDAMSAKGSVRLDGTLTLPLLGPVTMAGQKPEDVAQQLKVRLKPYVVAPEVTVVIEQSRVNVAIVGEVKGVGVMELDSPATVLQALAKAGGMTEFADTDSIFVLRPIGGGRSRRIRLTYKQLIDAVPAAIGFYLKSGDVVVVE
jgi:polysaccharide biosynthesis/export protein